MSLKKRLVILLLISGCFLGFIFHISFSFTVLPSLEEQKQIFIQKLKKKIEVALAIEQDNMALLCKDWSDWDSLQNYLKVPNRSFEETALPDEMFIDEMIDIVTVINKRKKIVLYKNYLPNKGFLSKREQHVSRSFLRICDFLEVRKKNQYNGFVNTSNGPFMFVAKPVPDNVNNRRTVGYIFMGRYLDHRMLNRFSSYTTEKIFILDLNTTQLAAFSLKKKKSGDNIYYTEQKNIITVFHLLETMDHIPAVALYTQSDNLLFSIVSRHIIHFIFIVTVLVTILGIALYFLIEFYIVHRVLGISRQMRKIDGLEDLSNRIVADTKKDEISNLISSINVTLDRLEQEKLHRQKAEKSMIKQGKLASIGRLTSNIAHEINNPILAISNGLQVIKKICRKKRRSDETDLLNEAVEICETEIHRIRDIISGLLDFHRLDREEFSRVDLRANINHSLNVLNWSNKLAAIQLTLELEENCIVTGAPVKLEQVFINFISNAVEAMETIPDGRLIIRLRTSADGKQAEIHFIDTGPGLHQSIHHSLFEPFVTTKEDRGVGLGLYISYKIVQQHKGEIIYNEEYKNGAHFIIRLPK